MCYDDSIEKAILTDRIMVTRRTFEERGIENFAMSWSGGKDSCVMSTIVDMAVPNNKIPRVYADTGLDLTIMRDFIKEQMGRDSRIIRIKPTVDIKEMLKQEGYPFSSKRFSETLCKYQRDGASGDWVKHYLGIHEDGKQWKGNYKCPESLKYCFSPDFNIKVSDKCCKYMKENVLDNWLKANGYKYHIIGLMAEEGGRRQSVGCFAFKSGKFRAFQPLAPLTKEWEDWFIDKYNIDICDIYKPPYNNQRTGCKGCPFSKHLQEELDMMEKYFPADRKQCERLWKPVYDEYRRIGYRLKKEEV